jgi:hypothetical protein
VAKHQSNIAESIDIVEVLDKAGSLTSFNYIRAILKRTKNITTLYLQISFEPDRYILPPALVFQNLTTLNVNVPHAALAHFLLKHLEIQNLVLSGPCDLPTCPLTGCHLPRLEDLVCLPGCVRALTSGSPLQRLGVLQNTAQDHHSFQLIQLLNLTPIPSSCILTTLHLDFDHTITDLLTRIDAAAPGLRFLKLTESPFSDMVS